MAPKGPKLGDRVIQHGRLHEVTALPERPRMRDGKPAVIKGVEFENDAYHVTMILDDSLRYSEEDNAWYFMGRLLARNERAVCEAITGAWPPAANHEAMRSMLDSVDLNGVDRGKLVGVLLRRKSDTGVSVKVERDGDGKPIPLELTDMQTATLRAYADAALEQCAELRAIRLEG